MIGVGVGVWTGAFLKAPAYNLNFDALFELDAFSGVTESGGAVSQWDAARSTRSGAAFTGGTNKPTLTDVAGTPVVRFAGGVNDPLTANAAGNNLGLDLTDRWTFFALVRQAIGSNGVWFRMGVTASWQRIGWDYNTANRRQGSTFRKSSTDSDTFLTFTTNSTPSPQDWHLVTGMYDGSGATGQRVAWSNRTKVVNTTTPWTGTYTQQAITAGHFYLGSADGSTTFSDAGIDVAFMGLYRHAFSDAEHSDFADWLEQKYGVTIP